MNANAPASINAVPRRDAAAVAAVSTEFRDSAETHRAEMEVKLRVPDGW